MTFAREDRSFGEGKAVMEWVAKLEAESGWEEVETIEVGRIQCRVLGLTAEEVGLMLAEGKELLGALARLMLQTQMEEFVTCARVCRDCMKLRRLRDGRTRKVQTLFGTITVDAPGISVCPCRNVWNFVDVSQSPLAELLPDRCRIARYAEMLRQSQVPLLLEGLINRLKTLKRAMFGRAGVELLRARMMPLWSAISHID